MKILKKTSAKRKFTLVKEIIRNLRKDILIEIRSRHALNLSLTFAGVSTLAISLMSGGVPFSPQIQAILMWVIIFFSAMNGLAHIFIREEEERTALFLITSTKPEAIFLSKVTFNIFFFLIIVTIISILFIFFLDVTIFNITLFILSTFSGAVAIAAMTTILGSMVSRAGGKGSLFTIISLPVMLPVLWVSINTTFRSLQKSLPTDYGDIIFLLAFSGGVTALSLLLFKAIWFER